MKPSSDVSGQPLEGDTVLLRTGARRLAWTEAVTLVSVDHVPDNMYELARQQFTEKEWSDSPSRLSR